MCAVAAVSTGYAAGPASATISPAAASTAATRRRATSSPIATTSPPTSTVGASQGTKSALRCSSTYDQAAVTARVRDRTILCRHSATAPMPTTAPIAGARATV